MGLIQDKEEINRRDRDGKKHGKWKEFYKNGKIKKEETYFHGVIEGLIKSFNKDGGIKDIEIYKDGIEEEKKINLKVNRSTVIDEEGNELIGVIYNEKKQGLFKVYNYKKEVICYKYFDNDTLTKKGMYDSLQRKIGKWVYYYKNKQIRKTGYYNQGKMDSIWDYYYKDGSLQQKGKYIQDLPEEKWVLWYKNKKIKREEYYLKGEENGLVIELDSLGNVLTKGQYSFGEREGEWFYVINDFKEVGEYIGGMKTGIWKTTYLNTGNVKYIGEFLNDIPLGEHKEFHSNGKVKEVGKYKDGEKNGEWKKYNYEGEIIVTYLYKRGVEFKRDGFKIKE
jgi:antitoxin component YwqK of YwqJK toxin-antitoxin module